MALTDNPFFKSLFPQMVPQGQAPVTPQTPAAPNAQVSTPQPGQAAVSPQGQAPTQPVPPQAQFQQYQRPTRPGSPNREQNPLAPDNQQTYEPYNPTGYNTIPLYDKGGDVSVKDDPSVLKKLGDKAEDVVSAVKTLPPNDSEAESIREKQAQIDALAAQRAPEQQKGMKPIVTTESDLVHPAPYGTRPGSGQVLYKVDPDGNITPLQVAPPAPATHQTAAPIAQPEQAPRMKPIIPESLKTPLPLYDKGGDVSMDAARRAQSAGDSYLNSFMSAPTEKTTAPATVQDTTGDSGAFGIAGFRQGARDREAGKEARVTTDRGTNVLKPSYMPGGGPIVEAPPIYDDGGEVNVNDGKHQLAILQDGERVLTPEEADKYRKEHPEQKGAPADFNGRVLPNPKGYKPIMDTEDNRQSDTDRLPGGAKLSTDNAPLKTPQGDISNPPAADVGQDQAREVSAKTTRLGGSIAEPKPIPQPEVQQPVEEKPKPTLGQGLAADWLKRMGDRSQKYGLGAPTPEQGQSSPAQPAPPQQGMKPIVPDHKAKLAKYDADIQAALDTGTSEGHEKALLLQEAKQNYMKNTPLGSAENRPGVLGKLGHVASIAGQVGLAATAPGMNAIIPGTVANRNIEHAQTEKELPAAMAATSAETAAEAKSNAAGKPKLLPGVDNTATAPDGTRYQRYEMPDSSPRWAKEGEVPTMESPKNPPTGAAPAAPTIGTQPNVAEHPAVLASAKLPEGTVVGKPPVPKEGEQPATAAQLADVDTRLKNNPYVPKEAMDSLRFPANYKPTQNDVKERLANIKEIEDATRQGKQDTAMNALRKLQEENQNLLVKAHLADLEDKHQQAQAKEAVNASVALAGLYAQENYKDTMDKWYQSGNFAKDSGLVTEIVNKEHSDKGAFSSVMGDALIGSFIGPEGAAVGAGVGALTGLIAGPANGYLETLKKQGISDEGYDAMQAYFNALPARMSYEIAVQGVSASAMRSQQLIQKVLNTVPPPNTPQDVFDPSFNQYYKPMEFLTKGKVELTKPKGYVAPTKEDIYPTKKPAAKNPQVRPTGIPEGATHVYRDKQNKVVGYALDGKYHSLTK